MVAEQPVVAILVMAAAAYLTRIAGYFLMGYVRVTPRVEAWLAALPISVMAAVLAPQAAAAGIPEIGGFAATLGGYAILRNEIVGAVSGVAAVAILRALLG